MNTTKLRAMSLVRELRDIIQEIHDSGDCGHMLSDVLGMVNELCSKAYQLNLVGQAPAMSIPNEWRESLKELVQAMKDYEMDVGERAPEKHRRMMDTAEALLAAPSHSHDSEQEGK